MNNLTSRSHRGSSGSKPRRSVAAFAAYTLALTTVVVGAFPVSPVTPADAAPGDGVCYLIADSGGGNGGNDLLTIVDRGDFNPVTNETSIGTGTGTYGIEAMDMHPATLELYATNYDQLGTIDKLSGLFTPIGSPLGIARGALGDINIGDVDGLAFNYTTNVLYGAERQSGNDLLIQIDYATGSIVPDAFGPGIDYVSTNVASLPVGSPAGHDDIDDLAFDPFTNELYGSITGGGGPGRLVKLDPLTGLATDVGPYGTGDIEGMRFDAEGFLWGTSGTTPGQLFEINTTTGAATNPRTVDNGGDYESTVCYVPGSDMWVDKTVDNAFPIEGSTVTYTVDIFNAGPANATGVVVEDVLPAGVTFVSASGQGTYDDATGLWSIASILRNESASIDITVSVDAGTAGSTITNTATRIAVDQGDAVPNNDTASVDIFPDTYADLAVSKTVSNASPGEGDTITYTVTVINNGPNAATGVTIDDTLPGGLTFVSSSPSQGTYSSGLGVWTVGTIPAAGSATLGMDATVNAGTSLSTITNTASVGNTDVTDPDPTNDSDSVDLTVSLAGLEIVKSSDVTDPVEPGETITYTLDITNAGTSLLDGVNVTDPVPPGTTFVAGSTYVTGFSGGTYLDEFNSQSYSNSDGTVPWTTSWSEIGEGTNPTGGDIRVLTDTGTNPDQSPYQLRIKDDDRGIRRSADLAGASYGAVSFDFRKHRFDSNNDYVVLQVADSPTGTYRTLLSIGGQGTDSAYSNTGALPLALGELTGTTTFRFLTSGSLGNNDILWVDNFQVDFAIPAEGAGHDGPGLVAPADGYILPPGHTMQVTFDVVADTVLAQASIDNTATVDAIGAVPATDSVSDPVAQADLAVDKTVDNPNPNPGDTIQYTITVTNNGPSAARLIEVSDLLPAGVTYDSDNGGGAYDPATGSWTVGTLPPSGSATLVITATVDSGTAGTTITNTATITQSDRPDSDPTNDTDSADIDVPVVDLEVGKSVNNPTPNVGDTVVFTVTVTNNGPDVANGVSLDDLLPAGVTYVSDTTSQGSYASGVWTVGTLGDSATATLTLTATVDAGTFGTTITNVAAVASVDEVDSDPTNDTDSASITVQHTPAIQVVKDGPATATLGETVTYTFTISHTAASDLSPVTITGVTDDIAGAATYDSGDTNTNSLLDGGETWIYTATHVVGASDPDPLVNTVTVTGTDGDGDDVPDATDDHSTDIDYLPVLDIVKTGPAFALVGDTLTFTLTVSHDVSSDNSPVSNVTVTDDYAGAASYVSGDDGDNVLEAGETWTFTATYTVTAGDPDPLVNTGTASGDDQDGDPVTDTDTHTTDIIAPAITIEKTPDVQQILSGDDVVFTITVTNTGDAPLTDVTVTDVAAPACDTVFASLAVGVVESYDCTVLAVGADFVNTAAVVADHPAGGSVNDSDTANVDVIAPAIAIQKTPDLQTVVSGSDVTFTITVTNTGDVDLTNVVVSDAAAPVCDATYASLAAGAVESYSCTVTNVTADFVNTAGVVADHPAGGTVTDSDAATVDAINPAITILKTPDSQTILTGTAASFTITVINTGDVGLTNVLVSDPAAPACGGPIGDLAAGDSISYLCSLANVTVDFTNTASVAGDHAAGGSVTDSDTADVAVIDPAIEIRKTPDTQQILSGDDATFTITVTNTGDADLTNVTVTDAATPACNQVIGDLASGATTSYTCDAANVTADFVNTAVVVGDHAAGDSVTDSDTAAVDVIGPAVTIDKTPDVQQILSGDDAEFTITVTNTGDVDLTNVVVTDPLASDCNANFASLLVGASETFTCTASSVPADFTNTAAVVADHPAGGTVGDSDDAFVDVVAPAVEIEKTPDTQQILAGGTADFTITVTNTGDVDLTNVTVSDLLAPDCDAAVGGLAIGASTSYTCSLAGVAADFTNTAGVVADHPADGSVTDDDTADVDVVAPAIDIQKTPDNQEILAGQDATFTIAVTNTGDVDLTDVTVTDALVPNCDTTFATLVVGATESYTCTAATVAGDFTNTAAVVADHPAGGTVIASDTADVDVINPAIDIQKTPDTQQILVGADADFTITVTNTGDVGLTNVTVVDSLAPACSAAIGDLAAGASTSYTCDALAVPADFTNVASVIGDHAAGGSVADSDSADVDVVVPSIDIQKTPDAQTILVGGDADFTITVTNTGEIALTTVTVTDALAPSCDAAFASLAIGASETYNCTVAGVLADFTNIADVVGDHAAGGSVNDSDTADVDVVDPSIDIQKTPDLQTVLAGTDVTFTIEVTNTGDVDLTDVVVSDPLAPACDTTFASLAVGASETYDCTITNVASDFVNVASVVADHPAGGTVGDSDDATVDVVGPAIDIEKTPDSQQIANGGTADFTITVTNTGDVALSGVAVTDALAPACDNTIGALAVGEVVSYTCSLAGVTADFTNTADVVGAHIAGGTVSDTDDADVDVINPAIDVEKTPDIQQIANGGTADFTITVTNTGDVDLSGVAVTDALAPACDNTIGAMAVGEVVSYTCSLAGVTADFTNIADVAGTDPIGGPVADSDDADVDVINPAIDIQKTPDSQQVVSGGTADFTITVTNTGDVDLTGVAVADALAPACDLVIGDLAVGAVVSYSCSLAGVTADFTNVAAVSGTDPIGDSVADSDPADVDVVAPAIDIEKTPDSQQIISGSDADFTITVTNTGDVPLSNVAVTDALSPACDNTIGSMAVGEAVSYTCSVVGVTADFTNIAVVAGSHPTSPLVTDSDVADVDVIAPAIEIVKDPASQQIQNGGTADFTITVTNTGDVDLNNVAVTDALAPACDNTIGVLASGGSVSYTCSLAGATADFTNTAAVSGVDPSGGTVGDSDDALVDVINPAIDIQKTPDSQQVVGGGSADFTITVTNTGDVHLSGVAVTDALAPACDNTIGALAVGEVVSYTCSLAGVTADFTNVADVAGTDPIGGPVTDSDDADVDVIDPAIDVQKTPDSQQIASGGAADFTITVTNTGDVDLTGVAVIDALAPACNNTIGSMAVGEVVSYTCSLAGVTADFTNVADVAGTDPIGGPVADSDDALVDVIDPAIDVQKTPDSQQIANGGTADFTITVTNTGDVDLTGVTVTDALAPACDNTIGALAVGEVVSYTCSLAGVTADFTNVADVAGTDPIGGPVTDSDDADVDVIDPAIDVQKTPDSQQIASGGAADFTITVTNTGDVDLPGVTVTDALAPACDNTIGALAVGEVVSYTCSLAGVTADFTNVADVAGTDPIGGPVSDSDDADVDVINPAIDIQKTPDTQQVATGGTADFTITVTNTGDADLTAVAVTDALAPACDNTVGALAVGEVVSYTCSLAGVTADFTNVANVAGTDPIGGPVSASDTADVDVISPAIDVQKTPDSQQIASGGTADFTITVTNTGDVALSNVAVTDALAPACDNTIGALAVGEVVSYTCSLAGVTADFTNVADVAGSDPVGGPVSDSDDADVDVIAPAIDIQKTPDGQQVVSGGNADFTITVTNTGDVDLIGVVVTDTLAPACDNTIGTLAVGQVVSYTCSLAGVTADFTNVADVTGTDPIGSAVSASDDADVDVIAPDIDIQKTPDSQQIANGGTADFTITVTNTGDVDLVGVAVTDALAPACDNTVGALAVGEVVSYTCSLAGVTADFTNVADVAGTDPIGGPVADSDVADVDVANPAIDIQKTPDSQQLPSGGTADFTITVTNTGDVDLVGVVVTDALAPACDNTIGGLAVGEVVSYTCSLASVTADFTNVADVAGSHPVGGPAGDTDDAFVDIIAPQIDIQKTPDSQQIANGGTADFTITVTNVGDVDLTGVLVTDALAPACDLGIGDLAVGEVVSYTCSLAGVTADFTNIADVTGVDPVGAPVADTDDAFVDVIGPSVGIEKTADTPTVVVGGTADFTITVTNTGDVDLTGVVVTDALAPACDNTIGGLAVGEVVSYTCSLAGVTVDFTNVADVTGTDPIGGSVADGDDAVVDVIAPAIDIQKTPDSQQIVAGSAADFTITVTNTGDADLTAVAVTDALAPACDNTIGALSVGEVVSYTCSLADVAADFTNTASVSGVDPTGATVGASDDAVVDVIAPAIDIQKTPDNQQIYPGDTADFTITVTNTGDVDLVGVLATDALAPACANIIGALAVGEVVSYTCSLADVAADFTNVADVVGTDPLGGPVSDSDDAAVDVIAPAIDIQKTPDTQQILGGGTADFTITVTNTGDVDLTGVAVSDALVPACDLTVGDLAAGAIVSYACSLAGVAADFVNVADVAGTDPLGNPVVDTNDAAVDVIAPAIDLVKDPALQQILFGQDANFTITVTNTGDTPLTNVIITDPAAPACDTVIPALGINASATVTCSATNVTADFTNTASVVATHGAGGTVTASDTADVEVLAPAVDIQKTPDLQTVEVGATATFTITVTNAGVVPLTNVTVSDPQVPACDAAIGVLAVGASTSYTCDLANVTADFVNTASVDATDAAGNPATDSDTADVDVVAPAISISKSPDGQAVVVGGTATFTIDVTNIGDVDLSNVAVTDALAPLCDNVIGDLAVAETVSYTCDLAGIGADFTNTAAVTGDHAAGGSVTDSDTADVTVLVPSIDIEKTPDSQLVGPGDTATFTITVTNNGGTPLTGVTVTDALVPACDATVGDLAVGESTSYTCDLAGVAAGFTNTADVIGNDPLDNPVTDTDTADVVLVDPAISIEKTPDLQTLLSGETATFTITVTNTGDTPLTGVTVSDPLAPACDATVGDLAVGELASYTCDLAGVTADFTNVATVVADTPLASTVTDSDDALVDVVVPGVEIQKTPDTQQIHVGDDVTFTITVTNNGDQDLVDLAVTDPQAPVCDATILALAVGDSTSYDCTVTGVAADFTNIASVDGTDALGNPVSDSDDAAVDVIDPAITVDKTPDNQTVVSGGTADFTITVTNTGDVDLSGVAVTDTLAPACDNTIGTLATGATVSYTCSLAGVAAAFTNTAAVAGTDPLGLGVTDSDTADVAVLVPGIDIQKTPDLQQARSGDTVTFTITVTNAGATPLTGVTVTDAVVPACDAVIGDLAIGESTSYDCTTTVTEDFTNTADVTGDDPLGNPVTDTDAADVDVITPAISIAKSPDGQAIVVGGTATFTIEVTNTGDVDLSGVVVADALAPACDNNIGDLPVGGTVSYTCDLAGIGADFTNTADVTGTDPVGLTVTDSDTADVTVVAPGIDIQKTPDIQTLIAGDVATFTIIVTNTGATDLTDVTVSDPLAPACDNIIGDLPVGSAPVTYTCTVVAANSFTNTASVTASDPLGSPLSDEDTADVVALLRSNIEGTIAHDVAGDGSIGAGDGGFSGVDVTATWAGLDGVFGTADDEVFVVQTDANGDYSFDLVPPGAYQIVVDTADLPAGIDFQTLDPDSTLDDATALTLPEDTTISDVDFAYTATGSIGDTVFIDLDGNGIQGAGEPGVAGVHIAVAWHGPDGELGTADDLVFNTTTGPNGTYMVGGLPGGEFTVVIDALDIPTGLSGDVDQTVTLAPAQARNDVDFPFVGSGVIGDQVFEDLDLDGVYVSGEPGVPGVTVFTTWAGLDGVFGTSDDVLFTTVTDSSGQYSFDLLPPGEYLVEIDDSTVPNDLGSAPPVNVTLGPGETDLTADFPLIGNRPPVAVDDSDITDENTPVVITVLDDDSDPDGHDIAISTTTDPSNGTVTVNPDGTITYTPNPGFVGVDTFTYTICEVDGVSPSGIPATGLCDTATVTVTITDTNIGPGPEASFQTVVVGSPVGPMPVVDPDGGPVTVTFLSGDLPPGITWNPDGTFSGVTTQIGVYVSVYEVCDDDDPQICIEHTHTIAVTPQTLPGPGDDPDPDDPPDALPFTGANFGQMLWAALMLLLGGAGLVLFSRKRIEA